METIRVDVYLNETDSDSWAIRLELDRGNRVERLTDGTADQRYTVYLDVPVETGLHTLRFNAECEHNSAYFDDIRFYDDDGDELQTGQGVV